MTLLDTLNMDFLHAFLGGLAVNVGASSVALVLGGILAFALGVGMSARWRLVSMPLRTLNKLLHAVPTFVALLFLAGLVSDGSPLLGPYNDMRPVILLVLGIVVFVVASGADQFCTMFDSLEQGDRRAALLIIPSFGRAMQGLISASCFGAAIGVPEAMSVVLFTSEQMADEATRLMFFVAVGLLFVIAQKTCVLPFQLLHRFLDRRAVAAADEAGEHHEAA